MLPRPARLLPIAAAVAVAAAVALSGPLASAAPLDLSQLPGFPVVWSHDSSEAAPVKLGGLVFTIEPDSREVAAVDARSGSLRWRVAAPKGVTWSGLQASEPDWLLVTGSAADSTSVVGRLSLDGTLRWHVATGTAGEARLTESGLVQLLDRGHCLMQVLEGQRGRLLPYRVQGHHVEYFQKEGPPHSTCQVTATPHLVSHGLLVASDYQGHDGLRGLDARSQTKWEVPGRYFRLLDVDRGGDSATFFGYTQGQVPELVRVQLATGQLVWQRQLTGACTEDRMSRHPQVVGRRPGSLPAKEPVVLIQDCALAQLIELRSGAIRWTRIEPRPDTLTLLSDSQPVELGLGDAGDSFSLSASRSPAVMLRWVTVNGESAGAATLAPSTREVALVPGGVVAHNNDLDRVWMVRQDGSTAWEVAVRFGNAFRRDDLFVILPSEAGPTTQLLVELKSGRRHALAFDSPYVLGRVAGEPTLLLTTRRRPASVVGVRTGN